MTVKWRIKFFVDVWFSNFVWTGQSTSTMSLIPRCNVLVLVSVKREIQELNALFYTGWCVCVRVDRRWVLCMLLYIFRIKRGSWKYMSMDGYPNNIKCLPIFYIIRRVHHTRDKWKKKDEEKFRINNNRKMYNKIDNIKMFWSFSRRRFG